MEEQILGLEQDIPDKEGLASVIDLSLNEAGINDVISITICGKLSFQKID